jgi:hypothetical protein
MNRNEFVNSYGQPVDWLIGTAKQNPEAFLVLAAGAALLMRGRGGGSPRTPDYTRMQDWERGNGGNGDGKASEAANRIRETAGQYASSVTEQANRVARAAGDYASAASDTARSYASTAADYASDARRVVGSHASRFAGQAADLADRTQSAVRTGAGSVMREQPLAVALLGVAAGAALAALFPSTKVEEEALRPARDAVVERAREMGENVRQAASEAGEQLKQSAVDRGLSPDGVKEMVREAADTFTSRVSGKSESPDDPTSPGTNRTNGQAA